MVIVETAEAKQVCRATSTLLYSALEFDVKPCGEYTREDFLEILSRIAFDQEFANTGGKTLQLDRDEPVDVTSTARNPLAKSLLYHLRNEDEHMWFVASLNVDPSTAKAYAAAFHRR